MAKQARAYKITTYIEYTLYNLVIERSTDKQQSMSDYMRDLILSDLKNNDMVTLEHLEEIVYA